MEQSVNVWQQPGSVFQVWQEQLGITKRDVNTTSPLAMAYLGSAIVSMISLPGTLYFRMRPAM